MRLYFVRHGESVANVINEISNRGYRHGLTEKGVAQAQALAVRLACEQIGRIYSSPLLRAEQTAQILSDALGIPFEITDALREWDCGIAEGRSDPEAWALHRWVREEWAVHHRWESRIEDGESFLDARARFEPFFHRLVSDSLAGESVILVGHGSIFINMLPLVLSNVTLEFANSQHFPNTAFVLVEPRPQGAVCLEWCGIEMADDV